MRKTKMGAGRERSGGRRLEGWGCWPDGNGATPVKDDLGHSRSWETVVRSTDSI